MGQLLDRLATDMKAAMKARDKFKLSVIRMLRSELKYAEIAAGSPLGDDDVIRVLQREYKKRKDALAEFKAAGREQAADDLARELELIKGYLPQPLSEEQLTAIVQQAIAATGATAMADMGKVMAQVMEQVRGRSDGSTVSALVKKHLQK